MREKAFDVDVWSEGTGLSQDELREYLSERGQYVAQFIKLDLERRKSAPPRGDTKLHSRSNALKLLPPPLTEKTNSVDINVSDDLKLDDDVEKLVFGLVAQRTGFDVESLNVSYHVVEDLHLDSIKVGELVADAARTLHIEDKIDPTDFAASKLGDIINALASVAYHEDDLVAEDTLVERLEVTPPSYADVRHSEIRQKPAFRNEKLNKGFLQNIIKHEHRKELVVRTLLSLSEDKYLNDHRYEGTCILPAVMCLEALAQAGVHLLALPSLPEAVTIKNIELLRPVLFVKEQDLEIEIRVTALSDLSLSIHAELYVVNGTSLLCARAEYLFESTSENRSSQLISYEPGVSLTNEVYDSLFFQRGRFRRISKVFSVSDKSCHYLAEPFVAVEQTEQKRMFDGRWVLGDPYRRDALLQGVQLSIPGDKSLPIGVAEWRVFTTDEQSFYFCKSTIKSFESGTYEVDVRAGNGDGNLSESLIGYKIRVVKQTSIALNDLPFVQKLAPNNLKDTKSEKRANFKKFRSRRISSLHYPGITATLETSGKKFIGEVRNFSVRGLNIVLAGNSSTFSEGTPIDSVTLSHNGDVIYQGSARIRHLRDDGQMRVLGLFLAKDVNLQKLYQQHYRHLFSGELSRVIAPHSMNKDNSFEEWVMDVKTLFSAIRDFLAAKSEATKIHDHFTQQTNLQEMFEVAAPMVGQLMTELRNQLNRRVENFTPTLHHHYSKLFREYLGPVFCESPFTMRAFSKPLGYAGDYELMNMLYRSDAEGDSLFGRVLHFCSKADPSARATINRVTLLKNNIERVVAQAGTSKVRIASIGCGAARELGELLRGNPSIGRKIDVALLDQDHRALQNCERVLTPLASSTGVNVEFICEPIHELIKVGNLQVTLGRRQFIYSAGLFDYLDDATFTGLTKILYDALEIGGELTIGNMGSHSPSKRIMEYAMDWFLIYRSREDLLRLGGAVQSDPKAIWVDAEPDGLNLFLHIKRVR